MVEVLVVLGVNLAWTLPVFVVMLRTRKTRLKGMVEVRAMIVGVTRGLPTQVTFDYPVRAGWLRATRPWNKTQQSLILNPPRPGQTVAVLVDPDDPARAPEFPHLGVEGLFALLTGIISALLVLAIVLVVVLMVVL